MNGLVSVVLLLWSFCVGGLALSGKGYFCRDPDTGKLYSINSTWPSTSFCGNYTCKIKRKFKIGTEIPLREFTVTNTNNTQTAKDSDKKNELYNEEKGAESKNIITTVYPTEYISNNSKLHVSEINLENNKIGDKQNFSTGKSSEVTDRFLTDSEIKTISKLLHNVKKSDLEAIVDIYNLAQDIYEDMDKVTTNDVDQKAVKAKNARLVKVNGKKYWYEPLSRVNKAQSDMENQASNVYSNGIKMPTNDPSVYFKGPLLKNDFGLLPYYYPLSDFQRQSSYVHPGVKSPILQQTQKPCQNAAPKGYPLVVSPYPQVHSRVIKKPFSIETQKVIRPSVLLPYPFSYIQHYNMSTYPNNLYYNKPTYRSNLSINDNKDPSNPVAMNDKNTIGLLKTDYINQNYDKRDILLNTGSKKSDNTKIGDKKLFKEKSIFDTLFEHTKIDFKKPEWQTGPLSANILEDVRAHFEEKAKLLKPFSLRKKVQLEKVGRVKKIYELDRKKRNISDEVFEKVNDSYEIYIEKTTCHSDEDPGFYKMGNLSQPYPACCPQKIKENNH